MHVPSAAVLGQGRVSERFGINHSAKLLTRSPPRVVLDSCKTGGGRHDPGN
jgi:hypothetical protein